MAKYKIRQATEDDIHFVLNNLDPAEKKDVEGLTETCLEDTLKLLKEGLPVWAAESPEGQVFCIFGANPAAHVEGIGNISVPWMLATEELASHSLAFLRQCRGIVMLMGMDNDALTNYIGASNTKTIKWLEWCGFEVDRTPQPIGLQGQIYYQFWG